MGGLIFVLRTARYVEDREVVEFGEIQVFVEPDFVIMLRRGETPALGGLRWRLESEPEILRRGLMAVLYAVMELVVSGYDPVVEGLENDIDEIESEVFGGNPGVSRRIYELSREVIQFHQATQPLAAALKHLIRNPVVEYTYAREDRVVAPCEHGRVGAPLQESEGSCGTLPPSDRMVARRGKEDRGGLGEAMANRLFERICEIEDALVESCVQLLDQAKAIRNLTNYHWWPQSA